MYYIGIDGGGTKTKFVLFTQEGQEVDHCESIGTHYINVGFDGLKDVIKKGVKYLVKKNNLEKDEVIISLGLAGYGREEKVRHKIEKALGKALEGYTYYITNDAMIALKGALENYPGILAIAGTGSIALAKNEAGDVARCGGWGYLLGDEGSGYWMVKKLLEVFVKESDGRLEKTALYDIIKEALELQEDADLISILQNSTRQEISGFIDLLLKSATAGDQYALNIYEEGAKQLAELVNVLANQFASDRILASYCGGVFKTGDLFMANFIAHLDSRILLIAPRHEPCFGAYLFAKEQESI